MGIYTKEKDRDSLGDCLLKYYVATHLDPRWCSLKGRSPGPRLFGTEDAPSLLLRFQGRGEAYRKIN